MNKKPQLPYEDGSFDAVVCALSIDYLIRPVTVLREMTRVLRPGGFVAVIFSNRLFITKAIALWAGQDDVDHVYSVGSFFHYGGEGPKGLEAAKALDISPSATKGDPLYVVCAQKRKG